MTRDPLRWEQLATYPPRPFVRHRSDVPGPLRIARRSPTGGRPTIVSILIPTLDADRGGYLPRLLDQLEYQTYRDWELLLVAGDRRQGRALNVAASLATGAYLLTLDDDTRLISPRALESVVAAADADPTIGVAGGINLVSPDAPPFVRRAMREIPRRTTAPVTTVTDSDLAEHPFLLIRRDVFVAAGGENELIPRGLDPYLRETIRQLGYRIVVVPGADYSHWPPPTLRKLLAQFFRNGIASAYVNRHHPEWAIETPADHGPFRPRVPRLQRLLRFPVRLTQALATGKPIWFLCQIAYAAGFLRQWVRPKEGV